MNSAAQKSAMIKQIVKIASEQTGENERKKEKNRDLKL